MKSRIVAVGHLFLSRCLSFVTIAERCANGEVNIWKIVEAVHVPVSVVAPSLFASILIPISKRIRA